MVPGDPSNRKFEVKNLSTGQGGSEKIETRMKLLAGLDRSRTEIDQTGTMSAMDAHKTRALSLLTTDVARNAFDLTREPRHLRERYGMHPWGQRALMARRLVEAGASF